MPDLSITAEGLRQLQQIAGQREHALIEAHLRIAALEAENVQAKDLLRQVHERYGPSDESVTNQSTTGPAENAGPVSLSGRKRGKQPDAPAAGG